ncbi:uncharacterized protein T069G_11594 [Trichoderma breve]|uniref:Uncharacterized protein n=1 Tax=Trichoderma breve TaxID=2034170 RepID=A0A9W9E2P5_9HYPO|nr:uncharacterized protein T069G_11594 [Trichoderma breve]KAJ4854615.1 hypothetical protein T069G_11594 [Trichoderma breve]
MLTLEIQLSSGMATTQPTPMEEYLETTRMARVSFSEKDVPDVDDPEGISNELKPDNELESDNKFKLDSETKPDNENEPGNKPELNNGTNVSETLFNDFLAGKAITGRDEDQGISSYPYTLISKSPVDPSDPNT